MPDDQAAEKGVLLERFGATVERVKPAAIVHADHYCNVARRRAAEAECGLYADQFETESNFRAHYLHTGPEVWEQTGGSLDAFVMSAGTGGTIAGVSRYLKERHPGVRVVLADPQGSSLYHKVRCTDPTTPLAVADTTFSSSAGGQVKHGVAFAPEQAEQRVRRHRYDTVAEGIGVDRVTRNFARASVDDAVRVSDAEAVAMSRFLLHKEGACHCMGEGATDSATDSVTDGNSHLLISPRRPLCRQLQRGQLRGCRARGARAGARAHGGDGALRRRVAAPDQVLERRSASPRLGAHPLDATRPQLHSPRLGRQAEPLHPRTQPLLTAVLARLLAAAHQHAARRPDVRQRAAVRLQRRVVIPHAL